MPHIFSMIPGIIAVVLVFGGLIFFHELGHFLVARFFNMGVQTFSLGFGKTLYRKKVGQTTYQVAILPLGGYVALVGESPDAELPEGFTEKDSFSLRPAWQRLPVIAAGAIFNIILAVLIFWGIAASQGRIELLPSVGSVTANGPAAIAGVQSGDVITHLGGHAVASWGEIPALINDANGKEFMLSLLRDGQKKEVTVTPVKTDAALSAKWIIGIMASGDFRRIELSFTESFWTGLDSAKRMIVLTWKSLGELITGKASTDNLSGPIGITKIIYDEADKGVSNTLFIAALISINLGIMNLLPVPVLDGGHILFILFEMIFRRPMPVVVKEKATMVGLALLLGLMFFATYNDIFRRRNESATSASSTQSTMSNGTSSIQTHNTKNDESSSEKMSKAASGNASSVRLDVTPTQGSATNATLAP